MKLRYMLDTNIIIYLISKRSQSVVDKIHQHKDSGICISSITLAELEYCASKSMNYEKNIVSIQKMLAFFDILYFDEAAASSYGDIRAELERKGQVIGSLDMLIAGHAKSKGLILVTNNTREFSRVGGLMAEDWV